MNNAKVKNKEKNKRINNAKDLKVIYTTQQIF